MDASSILETYDFSTSSLVAGVIFGIIGYWFYKQGRKKQNTKIWILGLALMIYPYFTKGPKQDWAFGIIFCGLGYLFWNENEAS